MVVSVGSDVVDDSGVVTEGRLVVVASVDDVVGGLVVDVDVVVVVEATAAGLTSSGDSSSHCGNPAVDVTTNNPMTPYVRP